MLNIFYNVWGGFISHPVLITLSIVGIYVLGYALVEFIVGIVVLSNSLNTKWVIASAIFTTVLSIVFTIYSFLVEIYVVLVIISGLVVLLT